MLHSDVARYGHNCGTDLLHVVLRVCICCLCLGRLFSRRRERLTHSSTIPFTSGSMTWSISIIMRHCKVSLTVGRSCGCGQSQPNSGAVQCIYRCKVWTAVTFFFGLELSLKFAVPSFCSHFLSRKNMMIPLMSHSVLPPMC